ncbi:hypothetical protein AB0D12_36125 [Streptomyces sp. NPDC048479]|uniref:hypothetical protein n=1 Tax=Streptomyces sp. NPDC048479 TaxID=3154725 RepID=UPI003415952D
MNEAARLADQLQASRSGTSPASSTAKPRWSPSSTRAAKEAAFVPALTHVLAAVQTAGITDPAELAAIAAPRITRRTTASGARARVRTKAVLITPTGTGTGTGRAGVQAIASGSARLRPLIAEAARQGLRLAFTLRMPKTGRLHSRLRQPH